MSQLQFDKLTKFKLGHLNLRDEVHGSDHQTAGDLALSCTTSNLLMDLLEPGLCSMFYEAANEENTAQPALEGVEAVSSLPKLRTTLVKKLVIDKEYTGYLFSIQGGTGDLQIGDLKFNKIVINLLEGGSVNWTFRLQVSGLESETIGYLGTLINHWIDATLTISEDAQQTINEAGGNVVSIKADPKKDATDLFVEGAAKQ